LTNYNIKEKKKTSKNRKKPYLMI